MVVHETPRLTLQAWELSDFDEFALIARDPVVMRYIAEGVPWSDARVDEFIRLQCVHQQTLGYCNWKLCHKTSGRLIGICGLAPMPDLDATEIGWWLSPAYWGQGYAYEASKTVVNAAKEDYDLTSLVARVYRSNGRSIRLIERLGMSFAGTYKVGPPGEVLLFSINLATERSE